jgi:hypothetical protein
LPVDRGLKLVVSWRPEPDELLATVHEPGENIREGRILSGFGSDENLRFIIDHLDSKVFHVRQRLSPQQHGRGACSGDQRIGALTTSEKAALLGDKARRFYNLQI